MTTAVPTATLTDTRHSAPPSAEGTLVAASTLITSDIDKLDEDEAAALVKIVRYMTYENCDPSPLKTANKDRTLAIANPALDNPHLPQNGNFRDKTENQIQHTLACALIHHAAAWYHDHGCIGAMVHQLDAPTLMRMCYDEGAFSAWATERLAHETVCDRFPQPMLQGTPGQNQAARSIVYTILSKIPCLRYPLADAIVILFGSLFVIAANTNHHIAALPPSPADDVQACCAIEDVAIRALHFAGQIENDGSNICFTSRVESTLDFPKLLGTYKGYMDDQSKRI